MRSPTAAPAVKTRTTPVMLIVQERLLVFFVTCALVLAGVNVALADSAKKIRLHKVDATPHIDGVIDPVWSEADSTADFIQHSPYHGKEPSRKTVAKTLTTEHAIYCLIVGYDDEKNIQRITSMLDASTGDVVSLMLDTFSDKRTAYRFAVSASGARADCRLLDDARQRDFSWDGVWFSAARIYDWGFAVEMEIPYRSIQYDERLSEWGLDVDRWIPTLTEDIYLCEYEQNEGLRVSKFGRLVFEDFRPSVKGLNLEIYPVGISRAEYLHDSDYGVDWDAGVDVFYNPSQRLTFQMTANPDFAQIEADPFTFNITRYESYFDERRPFFTQGNEVFVPSGRDVSSGFYKPLELFYSRRIGKRLPDGSEVDLLLGTKAFGRLGDWEYGGFLAVTDEQDYYYDGEKLTEQQALFSSARIKKQVLGNSSVGLLYVGKTTEDEDTGVIDVDGAFRATDWQLSYQVARSYKNSEGDFAGSAGFLMFKEKWLLGIRGRHIGEDFDISQVGYVPWRGTTEFTALGGPGWYFDDGYVRQIMVYTGGSFSYEKVDDYTDRLGALGFNMQFRNNWGYEISLMAGRSKELEKEFTYYEANLSSWFDVSPRWDAHLNGGYAKTYNFARDYLASYTWVESEASWRPVDILSLGTSLNVFVEGNPDNNIEDVTLNTRPFFSLTPVNNLNVRVYVDNVYVHSTDRLEQVIGGLLFSYNFRPKSWIYLAINEVRDRSDEYDSEGSLLPNSLHLVDRACVFKVKYLFYF